jgi:hypothetical protein
MHYKHTSLGQLALDLDQAQTHYDLLHYDQRGIAILWERGAVDGCRWIKLRPDDPLIPEILRATEGRNDTYVTPNEFDGWRLVRLLRSLRANYVDLDGCTSLGDVLDCLTEQRLPCPSVVLYSGRGMHLYWLLESLPSKALPVWQRIQDALIRALAPLGADPTAKDCTRLLRLVGTRNAKNGEQVFGHILDGHRWSLRQLAFEVLGTEGKGRKPAEVRDIRVKRANPDKAIQGSIYARWYLVYQDLLRISEYHNHRIPAGHRDKWLFLAGAALSWFTHPQGIEAEIASLGKAHTDLEANDWLDAASPNVQRALDAAAGKTMIWHGQKVDPRYRFRRQTLYDWLQPIITDELQTKLRAILPDAEAARRDKARNRAVEGRYATNYTKQGVRTSNAEKRAQARLMRAQGLSYRGIAAELDMPLRTVWRWCQ